MYQYDTLVNQVRPVVLAAGDLMRRYFDQSHDVQEKDGGELVTKADTAVEEYLMSELHAIMPEAGFYAEESGISQPNAAYYWVIDPIDGTTNFIHQIPYFCCSIALTKNGVPVFAMIYQPLCDELFYASTGTGAWKNDQRLQLTDASLCQTSLVSFALPYQKGAYGYDGLVAAARTVLEQTGHMRHLGAAALDLAYCAAGRLDGAFFAGLRWWDSAAGLLLVQEAGGVSTDFAGNMLSAGSDSCIAGRPQVHRRLRAILSDLVS